MNSRNDKTKNKAAAPAIRGRRVEDAIASKIEHVANCRHCDCDMVYPIDWEQAEGTLWRVTLRCPNCEDVAPGIMDEELIEKFDCLLDRGTDSLVRDLRNLTYANMATEINTFVGALSEGHILPEDF